MRRLWELLLRAGQRPVTRRSKSVYGLGRSDRWVRLEERNGYAYMLNMTREVGPGRVSEPTA